MFEFIQNLLHFVHYHPHWAVIITFLIAFMESIAIIGLFIPGSTLLGLIGGLIGAHILDPTGIVIAAILGAILGDLFSYSLGFYYHAEIRAMWPFKHFSSLFEKAEKFFISHGGKSLFIARFFGPLRGSIPVIAGITRFAPLRFMIANVGSAVVWAPAYLFFGALIGHQIEQASPHHDVFKVFSQIIPAFILFWLVYYLLRSRVIALFRAINFQLKKWHRNMESYFLRNLLRDNFLSSSHRQLSTLILALSLFVTFVLLMDFILLHGPVQAINLPVYESLESLISPLAFKVMSGISLLGSSKVLLPVSAVILLFLWLRHQGRLALHWLVLLALTNGSALLLKHYVHVERPFAAMGLNLGYSFPSGHVAFAVAFWGFIGFMLLEKKLSPQTRSDIKALITFIILSVCCARLFLGVHWLTDVLASLLLSFAYLNFTILSYRRGRSIAQF